MSKYTQPKVLTEGGVRSVFLFIAELNGFKAGTVEDKVQFGKQCWYTTKLHDLDYYINEELTTKVTLGTITRAEFNTLPKAKFLNTNREVTYEDITYKKDELARKLVITAEHKRAEDDRSEAHENIWLERIYNTLDKHFQLKPGATITKAKASQGYKQAQIMLESNPSDTFEWDIPIELDASASMLQYMGILLDDSRLCSMTNLYGSDLSDPWHFDGIPRAQFKKSATPMLYGSSRACHELWQDGGFDYTLDQVKLFNQELSTGALGLANQFKEFLINYCNPKEFMSVKVFKDQFNIECNRFRNIGEKTTQYDLYDTETQAIRRIHHTTTKAIADLEQFRRYFVTLLIHNLDSQVADKVIGKCMDKYGWGLDIHDAFIVHPNSARDVRTWYAEAIDEIYANRTQILADYFASIGIGAEAQSAWNKVKEMAQPMTNFKCNRMALK